MELRYYQKEGLDALFAYWEKGGGNALLDFATGTGKSLVQAELFRRLISDWPDMRLLALVHVRELVQQNAQELLRLWPSAPIGVNSAGLGRRDKRSQILFASIQSVAKESADTLGERHLILVDEAHLIPSAGSGQYRTLIARLRERVPDLRLVGLTATPYRLDSGRLDKGEDRLFDDVVFTYDIARGVDDGFLAPLVSRATAQIIDVTGVRRSGGEFVSGALEAAANKDDVTQAACDEIVAKGAERRSWLVFCAGVAHAEAVRDALRQRGVSCETVTGETPKKGDRDRFTSEFKAGRIRCLTNANVLTTGFNAPNVDLIAMLRPTLSTSLYVQMLGRGTRLASGKENCLVLDFAQNVRRHGPVDAVSIKDGPSGGSGRTEVDAVAAKECPSCETLVALRVYDCPCCGHEWERPTAAVHDARPDVESPVMAREVIDRWLSVSKATADIHFGSSSKPTMRVEYLVGATIYKEWVCLEHSGFAGAKAAKWWRTVIGTDAPAASDEGAARFPQEARILAITIERDGKYWRVNGWRVRRHDGRIVEIDANLHARPVALQLMEKAS